MIEHNKNIPRKGSTFFSLSSIGVLGLLFCVGISIYTSYVLVKPFYYSPYDFYWKLFYIAVFTMCGILCWIWHGRLLIYITLIAVVLVITIPIVLANSGLAIIMLVWITTISAALGNQLLNYLLPSPSTDKLERLILSTSFGFGLIALGIMGLGLLQLLYQPVAFSLLTLLTVFLLLPLRDRIKPTLFSLEIYAKQLWRRTDLRFEALMFASIAICLFGGFIWALAPSVHYDALTYHLAVPAIFVREHAIIEVPGQFRSYWAHYAEMLFTLGLLLADQPLPTLIHFVFGVLITALIYTLGRRIVDSQVGLIAAILFISVPMVTWLTGVAYVDLVVTLYTFSACYAVIIGLSEQNNRWLIVAGIFSGFALGAKLNAFLILIPLFLIIIVFSLLRYHLSRHFFRSLIAFGFPALLLSLPWLVRDWIWTGNPIFPYYNGIFRSPYWSIENTFLNFAQFGKGHGLLALLCLPWDLTTNSDLFTEAMPNGILGGLALFAVPWFNPMRSYSSSRRMIIAMYMISLVTVGLWFKIGQFARYLLPIFPILSILAAINIKLLWLRISKHSSSMSFSAIGLLLVLYLMGTRFVNTIHNFYIGERFPYELFLGIESPQNFLSRTLPIYDPFQFLNRQGDGKHKVLSVGNNFMMYSISRIFSVQDSREAKQFSAQLLTVPQLARVLESYGYDFMLVNRNETGRKSLMYQIPVLDDSFINQYTHLEFVKNNIYVYRLYSKPVQVSIEESQNLITNSGFEDLDDRGNPIDWSIYGSPIMKLSGSGTHSGKISVMVDTPNYLFQQLAIEPSHIYTLGHWTRAKRPDGFARLQINWFDRNLNLIDATIDVIPVETAWGWHQMTVMSPEGASIAQIFASVQDKSQVWFDDFLFIEGEKR